MCVDIFSKQGGGGYVTHAGGSSMAATISGRYVRPPRILQTYASEGYHQARIPAELTFWNSRKLRRNTWQLFQIDTTSQRLLHLPKQVEISDDNFDEETPALLARFQALTGWRLLDWQAQGVDSLRKGHDFLFFL